jgi:thiaminase
VVEVGEREVGVSIFYLYSLVKSMRNNLYINFLYNNCYSTFLSKNNIEKIDLYINNYNEKIVNNITNIKKEYYQKFIDVYHTKELSKLTQDSPL